MLVSFALIDEALRGSFSRSDRIDSFFASRSVSAIKAYFDDYTVPGRYRKLYVARTLPSPGGAPFRNGDEF